MDPSSCMICFSSGPGLHRFPRDKKRLKDWLVAIERTDLLESEFVCSIVYNSGRVCKAHFSDSCFCGKDKKKLLKNAVPRLSSSVKKESTDEDECSTIAKKATDLRKYRHCKKTAKIAVSRLSSPVKKKSTTKEKGSTTSNKAPVLRKYRQCKKMAKKSVPSLSNAKNKSTTKKRRNISENAQECNASQGDNNAVSEKSSYVNMEMESSYDIEKEYSVNIKKEPSDNIEMESSDNMEKESSVNIEKQPLVNIENPSIRKELGAEIPNNQSITCVESKTKDVNLIGPMKKILEENISNVVSGKQEPEKIIGATKVFGELLFLVKWKGVNEADLLPSTFVRKEFSDILIQFYEERLEWAPKPSGLRENWY